MRQPTVNPPADRTPARTPARTRRHRTLAALALVAATLGVTACGGDESSSPAPATTAAAADAPATTAAPAAAAPEVPKPDPDAPVEDQLGFDQAGIQARQSRVEAAIRDCMKAEGFEYVPIDPLAQRAAITGSGRLSDEDFLKQFGYGISTFWGRGTTQADPNARIRASLGDADGRAYDRTLWGETVGATFTEAVDSGDFSKLGGCTRTATEAVFGGAQVLTQLQGRLDQLDERILEDQRMVRALERWAECVAKAGYRYEDPEEIDSDLFKRTEAIVGTLPGQFATGPAPGQTPPPYDRAALTSLQREEVAIAQADLACEVKHIEPVEEKVRPQYESEFRERNRSLISQIKPVS
jgi:hypothetical protein